jgi:hypothetical protein
MNGPFVIAVWAKSSLGLTSVEHRLLVTLWATQVISRVGLAIYLLTVVPKVFPVTR